MPFLSFVSLFVFQLANPTHKTEHLENLLDLFHVSDREIAHRKCLEREKIG